MNEKRVNYLDYNINWHVFILSFNFILNNLLYDLKAAYIIYHFLHALSSLLLIQIL